MLDRTSPPLFQKSLSYDLITPERIELENGTTLLFLNGGSQDVAKIECIFKAGKWYEPSPGVSYFVANLINKGTSTKSSFQITNAFDALGMHFEISAGYDFTSVTLYGLTKNIPSILNLFFELLSDASFPEDELALIKNIYIQNLKVNLEKTSYLAAKEFRGQLFGTGHPYGNDVSIPQVEALKQSDLKQFFKKNFINPTILVSGKLDGSLKELLIQMASRSMHKPIEEPSFTPQSQKNFVRIEKSGSIQTSIRIGKFSLPRAHEDYPALLLVNHILGGYFGSRLMKNIREEKGLTYGIHASLSALKHQSFITIGADVNKENTELTIQEIKKEIADLQSSKISVQELTTVQNHFIGSLQLELSTPFAHADKIKTITLFSLSNSYYKNLIEQIAELDQNQIINTAQKHFKIDSLITVAVG